MSLRNLLLMTGFCLASVLLIAALATSAYIAISYQWLLLPIGIWITAFVIYRMTDKRK